VPRLGWLLPGCFRLWTLLLLAVGGEVGAYKVVTLYWNATSPRPAFRGSAGIVSVFEENAAVQARGTDHTYATPHPDNPTLQTPYHLDPNEKPLNRHIAYMHFIRTSIKTASKQRIMEATPQTPVIKGLSRQQEVFINKVIANAAYTPHIVNEMVDERRPREGRGHVSFYVGAHFRALLFTFAR
ncbi:hypothetical protein HPB47_002526, partial [Ixodes persulcatus]